MDSSISNHSNEQDEKVEGVGKSADQQDQRDYEWWDQRARDETPLTEAEEKVIWGCGGLSYIRTYGQECGFGAAKIRTISEKHYFDCQPNCICGRH